MVKLTGPMTSAEASGSFGRILTFGKTKGRAIARKRPTPKQPRSGLQVSMRAMMTFLSQQWTNLTDNQQATWLNAYADPELSAYNAFIKHNCERWRSHRAPSKEYPATEIGFVGLDKNLVVTGGVRHTVIEVWEGFFIQPGWTYLLFHKLGGMPTTDVDDLVYVFRVENLDHQFWTHTPLPPGTHHYRIIPTAANGLNELWGVVTTDSAVVT